MPWIHHTLVNTPFTDFTWQHIKRTAARRADRAQHEHDLALALRDLLERATAGHGTRREKVVAARARTAATDGAVWGILYGRQPQTEADEPGENVFGDSEDDEEPVTGDGALSIWSTEPTPQSDSPTGAVQEAGLPAPRRPQVTVHDPFEESLRW